MLIELAVRDLGVVEDARIVFGPGMTAITGETGAGKTVLVGALDLLLGGRAESSMVRHGASEATVEARFEKDDDEVVLRRVVPREGRSRAYIDGSMCTVATLADAGGVLADLHGQHAHQSLLERSAARLALDRFADVDLRPLQELRQQLHEVRQRLDALGGDGRVRARQLDLCRFQLAEIDAVAIEDADEDVRLAETERRLASVVEDRLAAAEALEALDSDTGAVHLAGTAVAALRDQPTFASHRERLEALTAELVDLRVELRRAAEGLEDDPDTLERVRQRRAELRQLVRKYGDDLGEVLTFADQLRAEIDELARHDERAAELEAERARLEGEQRRAGEVVAAARRQAADAFAHAVQDQLRPLAMPTARMEVTVNGDEGQEVAFLFAADGGAPALPLTKVASGGELSRVMLAIRRVLATAPPTLVFDEVDAGIGGETGGVLAQSLAELAATHQVLVVTHLPQVAAIAECQVVIDKRPGEQVSTTTVRVVEGTEREREIARMLSGSVDSASARAHARELLRSPR